MTAKQEELIIQGRFLTEDAGDEEPSKIDILRKLLITQAIRAEYLTVTNAIPLVA